MLSVKEMEEVPSSAEKKEQIGGFIPLYIYIFSYNDASLMFYSRFLDKIMIKNTELDGCRFFENLQKTDIQGTFEWKSKV